MVHCSFIFGHGWLHSNQFCKTCQNLFCQSWCCLCCLMAFAGAFTTKQQIMHPHCFGYYDKTWMKTVLTLIQKWLLCSHPWPNMNDQCTIWRKNIILLHVSSTDNNFMICHFDFERFSIESRFPFFLYTHCIVRLIKSAWTQPRMLN